MNYWPAEVTQPGRVPRAAVRHDRGAARARGDDRQGQLRRRRLGAAHHNTDLWRATAPVDSARTGASGRRAAPGSATHLWEHYAFSGDQAFLRRGLPDHEGRGRVLPRLRSSRMPKHSGWSPARRSRRRTRSSPTTAARRCLHGPDDGHGRSSATCSPTASRPREILGIGRGVRGAAERTRATGSPRTRSAARAAAGMARRLGRAPSRTTATSRTSTALYPGDQITPDGTPELVAAARGSRWSCAATTAPAGRMGVEDQPLGAAAATATMRYQICQ